MSNALIVCPSCGRKVTGGRFCKSCGQPLPEDLVTGTTEYFVPVLTDSGSSTGGFIVGPEAKLPATPDFGISIDGMDSRVFSILLAQAELQVIGKELDQLIGQIEATRQALLLKHADKAILASRAEGLRQAFEKTKSRREQLRAVKGLLPIEKTLDELEVQQSKLSKLEKLKGSVDSQVYGEEHEKITIAINQLRDDLRRAVDEARRWLKAMSKKLADLKREASRLDAKHKIGDMPTSAYEESRLEVDRSIRILKGSEELLSSVLAAAEEK